MSETAELDKTRRYLRPVNVTTVSGEPDGVHLSVYEWLPRFEEWVTGLALCGASVEQGALPEGTVVTCSDCKAYRPKYERMLAPGYNPAADDPETLRARAEAAEALLQEYLSIVAVTHKYRSMGGHDCLGANLTCSGCALAEQAREHLGRHR